MTTLGRYEIIAELGTGPMGAVYRAHDTMLDRQVALKVLAADAANDSELVQRFYREAKICARLRHPNLVPVYDIGQENGIPYIVMELIDGPNLRQMMADGSPMTLDEKLQIVDAISEGLSYTHSMGVIHRDIKPSNIVVEKDGHVRILDFGVALTAASSLTVTGTVLGTPQYMSPEQALGKQCDERSESFSLAVVAFELISGKHPFDKRTGLPSNSDLALSQEILAVLQRAMNQAPQARYASAREFAIALRAASQTSLPVRPLDETPIPEPKPRRIGGTETILSAVLVNLQRFEEAADNGDLAGAREAMIAMRQAGADDTRYAIALEQSAKRLDELELQKPACAAGNFDATALFEPTSHAASASVPFLSPPVFQAQPTVTVATPSTRTIVRTTQETIAPTTESHRVRSTRWSSVIIVALALCCVLLGGVYLVTDDWRKVPQPLPYVATAEVVNVEAPLYAEPNATGPPSAIAHHGDVVNILRAPRDSQQQWTSVQWISAGKPTPAVFAHTADLGKWSSTDPSLDEALRQMFPMSPRVAR
ncbi:MAG TPA: serine/threonine-protein kinase [Bryobacteraceae bacterium]|nr:serine/threonine-protein kinase [Bryobacteraceae bacterium]